MPPRSPRTVLEAWLITGPLGHLWCSGRDWAAVFRHWAWFRMRGKDPWADPWEPPT